MKTKRLALSLSLCLLAISSFSYAASIQIEALPQSQIWVSGNSTLHPFVIKASTFNIEMAIAASEKESAKTAILKGLPVKLQLTIPIKGLRSEFEAMDDNTQKAMKAKKYPDIVFSLKSYSLSNLNGKESIAALGTLSISGVSKPVTLHGALKISKSKITVTGSQPILMKDYGITPPTMMFDTIKVDNKVVVHYHLILTQAENISASASLAAGL
jgi:polyisoprenoid-binding protein YceI